MIKPGYINDQWVLGDDLGMGRAGDALARMTLEVSPPFTIGVTGKWGSGKTSVLRRAFATLGGLPISQNLQLGDDNTELTKDEFKAIRHDLRNDEILWPNPHHLVAGQSLCIWYSPWQHQSTGNPLIPLLQEIRAQYCVKRKWLEKSKTLNRQGGLAALTLLEHAIDAVISWNIGKPVKVTVGASESIRNAWRENNPETLAQVSDGQRFHLLFEDAVTALLNDLATSDNPGQPRLIIFIDDLDRCEEKAKKPTEESLTHRRQSLDSVAQNFLDRLDRKRSDEYFVRWVRRDLDPNEQVEDMFLQITLVDKQTLVDE